MAVTIKIHRGTDQIGGTITEIYTENTHIFIDFGSELSVSDEKSTDPAMVRMIQSAKCDGVLFTHYHGDHIGLMGKIPEKDTQGNTIRLGIGPVSRKILQNIHKTLCDNRKLSSSERSEHKRLLELLCEKKRWKDYCDEEEFEIGDFKITPIRADHSAYDAYLLMIEAEGKCILHTGDFRTHGRLGKDMFSRISKILESKKVDVLLTEGTMMSRRSEKLLTEEELERRAREELSKPQHKYAFLVCSSTNVESLASFHNAALHLGRPFIVNRYVYEQLLLYSEYAGAENRKFKFWKAYPFERRGVYNQRMKATQLDHIREKGFVMLVGTSDAYTERMNDFRQDDPLLIYSMWDGYLRKENEAYNPKLRELYDKWPRHLDLHTSGHACKEDIEEMIRLVHPMEAIIPIHTEKKELFRKLDIGALKELVKPLSDGDCYTISGENQI